MRDDPAAPGLGFFLNPFFRKFAGKIIVITLSEPEHRLRDARTLLALHQYLPPEETALTVYRTVTIGGREGPHWPAEMLDRPDTGVILVGRPALFGGEAQAFLEGCAPQMVYTFHRNTCPDKLITTRRDYRAIVAPLAVKQRFQSELFDEARNKQPRPARLRDLGIVYSGWSGTHPVVVYGGSSTVSTWGAAVWSMHMPGRGDIRWYQDVQGVIESSVVNTPRAFQTVHGEVHEEQLLTPVNIWMDGPDLPPADRWRERLSAPEAERARIRIFANGKPVFRPKGFMIPIVLLAWMNLWQEEPRTGLRRSTCTTPEVLAWIDAFLGRPDAMGARAEVQSWVNGILNDAVQYFNEAGGLATLDSKIRPNRFTLWFREPPGFLPVYRL